MDGKWQSDADMDTERKADADTQRERLTLRCEPRIRWHRRSEIFHKVDTQDGKNTNMTLESRKGKVSNDGKTLVEESEYILPQFSPLFIGYVAESEMEWQTFDKRHISSQPSFTANDHHQHRILSCDKATMSMSDGL